MSRREIIIISPAEIAEIAEIMDKKQYMKPEMLEELLAPACIVYTSGGYLPDNPQDPSSTSRTCPPDSLASKTTPLVWVVTKASVWLPTKASVWLPPKARV